MEEDKLIESKKILTDYMLELNSDIQRAEDWANTGADEEMYFALQTVLNELEILQKEFKAVDHECSRLELKEIELEKENKKYRLEIIPRLEGDIQAYKQRIDELKKESEDWQKAYQEEKDEQFNMLTKKCSLCNENIPLYCETCYQDLITKNAELQLKFEKYRKFHLRSLKRWMDRLDRQAECFNELLDEYIDKQVIRDKIEELENVKLCSGRTYGILLEDALKELLGE